MQSINATPGYAEPGMMDLPKDLQIYAYNAAFSELGLRFRWDPGVLDSLGSIQCEKSRIAEFIRQYHPHLLKSYNAEFLSTLIYERKNEYLRLRSMQDQGEAAHNAQGASNRTVEHTRQVAQVS
ncbi:hypothetical protein THIX_60143 [Thiomonas sp. X19]|uniref:hypothetical protein n=1 Tax=Thiomonas sp. X19 TaxID=1050370 RepID=UPI000B64DC70|nr:hypothetical protein [Thiomonas sp. X19]SCC94085.1 hypothetical protein THIX_60143 [Thiomonas sp. X19]